MNSNRSGFTLVELIIVTVLGTLILAAAMEVLITNQRTYTAQTAQIQSQQSTRAALGVLSSELREISARGGDLITMSQYSVEVRSMRKLGLVCALSAASPPVLRVMKVGDWFDQQDSVFIFADNNVNLSSDDAWISARVNAIDTTSITCGSRPAEDLSFASGEAGLFTADSVRVGAEVRSFVYYTYGLVTLNGATYLGRTDVNGNQVPLVGPLEPTDGVQFAYLDSIGNVTTTATEVRQIQVTVRTSSGAVNSVGQPVADSITGLIYTRN
jgi:prepilin-type N-terminal cleavage/methylation domain-containing protein